MTNAISLRSFLICAVTTLSHLSPVSGQELRLAAGDTVDISILNRPNLSGEFRVRVDGTVSMHLLEQLNANGLTEIEFERLIENTLEKKTSLPASVTVEVIEWRPIAVAGDVVNPGRQTFEIGLTTAHAVSLAGGGFPRVGETSGSSLEIRLASEAAEIDRRQVLLADLHARSLRLQAELKGQTSLDQDPDFERDHGELAKKLLEAQTTILQSQSAEDTVEIDSAMTRSKLAQEEADALKEQQRILNISISESEETLQQAEDLLERGLSNADRPRIARRSLNDEKIDLMQAASFEARALQQKAQSEAEILALKARRKAAVSRELYDVVTEIEATNQAIASSHAIIASLQPYASSFALEPSSLAPLHYRIRRKDLDGETKVLSADLDTGLKPGDVLEVKRGGWLEVLTD